MKKRYSIIALALLTVFGANAAERTTQQKRQIAMSVLGAKSGARSGAAISELKVMNALTVMGGKGVGFAVISNDDKNEAVLAVADGDFNADNMPDGLEWWLEAANAALESGDGYVRETRAIPEGLPEEVQPMLTCTWGQDTPYNDLCPSKWPTGCVATAMAQIMYYHKYPLQGKGEIYDRFSYKTVNLAEYQYDYSQMKDSYVSGNYSEAEGNAVATLMYHCGLASDMNYAPSASGTHGIFAAKGLAENFGYNPNVVCRQRAYYPNSRWMKMVYEELAAGRPILYSGSDKSMGGHAFVLTGYDKDGLVYVNWGWDGQNEGYYDINLLNPADYQFDSSQNMVVGIAKPDVEIPHTSEVTWYPDGANDKGLEVTANGTTVTAILQGKWLTNGNYYNFNGKIHFMLSGNGEERILNTIDLASLGTSISMGVHQGDGVSVYRWSFDRNLTGQISKLLPAGTYTLYLGVQDTGYDEISPIPFGEGLTSSYTLVKKDDGTIEINPTPATGIENAIVSNTTADDGIARVYTVDGVEIYAAPAASFSIDDVPAKGLLIVKKGGETTKVMKN